MDFETPTAADEFTPDPEPLRPDQPDETQDNPGPEPDWGESFQRLVLACAVQTSLVEEFPGVITPELFGPARTLSPRQRIAAAIEEYWKQYGSRPTITEIDEILRRDAMARSELCDATRHYYEFTIEKFGVDRCIFESNFPVDMVSCSYTVAVELVQPADVRLFVGGEGQAVPRHGVARLSSRGAGVGAMTVSSVNEPAPLLPVGDGTC